MITFNHFDFGGWQSFHDLDVFELVINNAVETINGADTDTDREEANVDCDIKDEHDDSKTDSNAEDVDVETN